MSNIVKGPLSPNFVASDPITVNPVQNVWTKFLNSNTRRTYLDIQNKDTVDQVLFLFTNNPFAISFDGGDHIDIDTVLGGGSALLTSEKGAITIKLRNPSSFGQDNTLFSLGDTDADEYLRLFIDNADSDKLKAELKTVAGGVQWALETDAGIDTIGGSSTSFYEIKLLQNRVSGADFGSVEPKLFVNGNFVAQTFTTSTDKTQWVTDISANVDNGRIGSLNINSAGEADQFEGIIDWLKIQDITRLNTFTTVAFYEMDEGTSTTITDRSGNGFDGTFGGGGAAPSWTARSDGRVLAPDSGRDFVDSECPHTAVWLNTTAASHGDVIIREG